MYPDSIDSYLIIRNLLLNSLLSPERDGVTDEFTVLLDKVLLSALLDVLQLVLLWGDKYVSTCIPFTHA